MSYDPSQPRDEQGQWTNTGGVGEPRQLKKEGFFGHGNQHPSQGSAESKAAELHRISPNKEYRIGKHISGMGFEVYSKPKA